MNDEPDPRDTPYDPDMTVAEALEAELIVVIDSDKRDIGARRKKMCCSPNISTNQPCTRSEGHKGVHAFVVRWNDEDAVRSWIHPDSKPFEDMSKAVFESGGQTFAEMQQKMQDLTSKVAKAEREQEEIFLRKAIDMVKPKDLTIEEYARGMTDAQKRSVMRVVDQVKRDVGKVEDRRLNKIDSMIYNAVVGKKKQRFRDQNAGKIRGK